MSLTLETHDCLDAVDPVAWDRLLAAAAGSSLFQSRAWCQSWWRHCSGDARPHVLTVHHCDQLVGLFAMQRSPQYLAGRWPRRVLTGLSSLSTAHAQSPGPLVAPDRESEVLAAMAQALSTEALADAIYFEHFLPSDPLARLIESIESGTGRRFLRWSGAVTHRVDLPASLEAFDQWLTSNQRKQLARARNHLARLDGRVRLVTGPDDLQALLDAFRHQNSVRLSGKGERSTFEDGRLAAFLHELSQAALADGSALFLALEAGGRIGGTLLAFQCGVSLAYYNGSFEAALDKASPGLLLFDAMFREAIARGVRSVDLMAGSDDYKRRWSRGNEIPLQYAALPLGNGWRNSPFNLWESIKSWRSPARF